MNNKNGFTIIELIISISILIIIVTLSVMGFNKIFDKTEDETYTEYVNSIKSAADVYLSGNNSLLTELNTNKGYLIITIKQLKDAGLLNSDLVNPKTKEAVIDTELVTVSLDENGLYKFTYPGVKKEEYLQTITKTLNYGENFNCLSDLDTINLGLIDKDGNLVTKYFNNNPSYISCAKSNVDTKKVGNHVITYSYVNSQGVTKEAKRNFVVIDHISPTVTNVDYSPKGWTNSNITISANINDNESGIGSYAVNLDKCDNFKATNASSITEVISRNGQYFVCAKDISGNVTESKINITNIDKTKPAVTVSKNISDYTTSLVITGNLTDNESKIIAYAINQTSSESGVTWTSITQANTRTVTKTITANGTYYVWAKDAAGNINKTSILIENIGTLLTNTFSTGKLSNRSYNGSYNTGGAIKKIISITSNTGQITNSSFSGMVISYVATNGTRQSESYSTTCYSSPSTASKVSDGYSCSSGTLVGSRCKSTVYTYYSMQYKYSGNRWSWFRTNSCSGNCNKPCPNSGQSSGSYITYSSCPPSGSGTEGQTKTCTENWKGYCYSSASIKYSCPSGYTEVSSTCYKCSTGTLDGTSCKRSCTGYNYYYRYNITVQYII